MTYYYTKEQYLCQWSASRGRVDENTKIILERFQSY